MFSLSNTFCEIFGYALSYAEFIATIFGLLCVYWASKENILTWPAGIVNEVFLFVVFYQVHLYANMFLQVVFFATTLYGWYEWRKPKEETTVTRLTRRGVWITIAIVLLGTIITTYVNSNIHTYLPQYFPEPTAYPLLDSLIMVMSIVASVLLAQKKIESWILWVGIDVLSVVLYEMQGIYFIALQYVVLLAMASGGLYNWSKKL